ncbi:hypothetical protein C7T35_15305 [Variovorax sp. WS11]|uniref:helix-turn-helix domain-containing protein n=1 Tax=Variovorax sp. WS11 TaxID=1105204 RepID=UPI000D0D6F24|nr:helix-turn-helix domain-containing protein [Variovorax sp. WS11]NDZ12071.1 hypothetical protein [Variovorax sp. WS11]PSL83748.1 hypothetical protein C7T35_15305 [Variovorax sp. WS11]
MEERPIDRLLHQARTLGMNQTKLAERLGVSPQDITNWKKRGMPAEWHATAAQAVLESVEWLLGLQVRPSIPQIGALSLGSEVKTPRRHRSVPIVSWIRAVLWNEDPPTREEIFKWVNDFVVPKQSLPGERAFALVMDLEYMINPIPGQLSLPPGTIIVVDPDHPSDAGDYVLARELETHSPIVGRLVRKGAALEVQVARPDLPAVEIKDPTQQIIGRVLEYQLNQQL